MNFRFNNVKFGDQKTVYVDSLLERKNLALNVAFPWQFNFIATVFPQDIFKYLNFNINSSYILIRIYNSVSFFVKDILPYANVYLCFLKLPRSQLTPALIHDYNESLRKQKQVFTQLQAKVTLLFDISLP